MKQKKENKIVVDVKKLKLLSGYILVEPVRAEHSTGFVNPDQYEDKNEFGVVVQTDSPERVKVGDTVLFGKYSTINLTLNGKDYLLVRQEDVIAILG